MRINILGGTGLVGYGIYQVLSKSHNVRIFSSDCFDFVNFHFKSDEVFDCDLFIHAAGVRDEEIVENFEFGLKKSTAFVGLILNGLNKFGCAKFVYVSSIHVFGDLSIEINSDRLPNPNSYYSLCHYCAEKVLELQSRIDRRNLNVLILRVPTVYGFQYDMKKINRPGIIQYSFLLSLLKEGVIKLRSNGEQFRLFASNIKVGEIVRMWINDESKGRIMFETVNGENFTVYNFAFLCKQRFSLLDKHKAVHVEKMHQPSLNDTFEPITVQGKYDLTEPYSVEKFIDDFFSMERE